MYNVFKKQNMAIPYLTPKSTKHLVKLRFLQGVTFPTMYGLIGKWYPPGESTIFVNIAGSGLYSQYRYLISSLCTYTP